MVGEWLTATANTNMFTYEIAPVFILMENVVMTHMREIIGSNWINGDSILAPGKLIYVIDLNIIRFHNLYLNLSLDCDVKAFLCYIYRWFNIKFVRFPSCEA